MRYLNKSTFFLLGLFLAFLPYCYLSFFANPSVDDFSLSGQALQNDFFHLMYHNYFFWNGRYISNVFIYLNPIVFGSFSGYKYVSFIMVFLLVLVNFVFVNQIFNNLKKNKRIVFSLVLSLLFIQNMPIISEGIYWFTGSVIYLLGLIVFLSYLSLLIYIIKGNNKKHLKLLLLLLLFLSCGFNEVLTLIVVFSLTVLGYIFYKKKLNQRGLIFIQLFFSLLFAATMIFSPGNAYREVVYENQHNFSYSLLFSLLQVARFSLIWIASVPLIAASSLYFQFNKEMRKNNSLIKNSFYLTRWASLFVLAMITFICVFPPYWATGILGQHRTLNVAYFFFLIMWFVNLTVWCNYYHEKLKFVLTKKIKVTVAGFLFLGILFTGNGYNSLSDIFSGSAKNYDKQMNLRYELLGKTKSESIAFSQIENKPKCLFVSDITNNPDDWKNQAYNLFFKIDFDQAIELRKSTE